MKEEGDDDNEEEEGDGRKHTHPVGQDDDEDRSRFVDKWFTSSWFKARGVVFKCPCGGILRVAVGSEATVCARGCGAKTKKEDAELFLKTTVAGTELYAYNREHARVYCSRGRSVAACGSSGSSRLPDLPHVDHAKASKSDSTG